MFSCPAISFFTLLSSHSSSINVSLIKTREMKEGRGKEKRLTGAETYNQLPRPPFKEWKERAVNNQLLFPFLPSQRKKGKVC